MIELLGATRVIGLQRALRSLLLKSVRGSDRLLLHHVHQILDENIEGLSDFMNRC